MSKIGASSALSSSIWPGWRVRRDADVPRLVEVRGLVDDAVLAVADDDPHPREAEALAAVLGDEHPFGRVVRTCWSVWSPMTTSTLMTPSARSTSGPVGAVRRAAGGAEVSDRDDRVRLGASLAASALTAAVEFRDVERIERAGLHQRRASSFVKPTKPIFMPFANVNVCDGDHSAGVCPFASTMFAETIREFGQRDQLCCAGSRPAVEVVVAEAVDVDAHHVHELDRRLVPEEVRDRRRRTDGVAGGQLDHAGLRRLTRPRPRTISNHVLRNAEPPMVNAALHPATRVVGRLAQRDQLAVVVADVEDRDLVGGVAVDEES